MQHLAQQTALLWLTLLLPAATLPSGDGPPAAASQNKRTHATTANRPALPRESELPIRITLRRHESMEQMKQEVQKRPHSIYLIPHPEDLSAALVPTIPFPTNHLSQEHLEATDASTYPLSSTGKQEHVPDLIPLPKFEGILSAPADQQAHATQLLQLLRDNLLCVSPGITRASELTAMVAAKLAQECSRRSLTEANGFLHSAKISFTRCRACPGKETVLAQFDEVIAFLRKAALTRPKLAPETALVQSTAVRQPEELEAAAALLSLASGKRQRLAPSIPAN